MTSFRSELAVYVGRISEFDRSDWLVYTTWVGLLAALTSLTLAFVWIGQNVGAPLPESTWLIPAGGLVFTAAVAIDTIGHRTIYKDALKRAEQLVHQLTIFCGVSSCVLLCAAFGARAGFFIPATVMTLLSFLYSLVDEVFHWHRYWSRQSDRVEMWSHLFILIGHGTMMLTWWNWCRLGYPGVSEMLSKLG